MSMRVTVHGPWLCLHRKENGSLWRAEESGDAGHTRELQAPWAKRNSLLSQGSSEDRRGGRRKRPRVLSQVLQLCGNGFKAGPRGAEGVS